VPYKDPTRRKKDPIKQRRYALKHLYGLTPEGYDQMLAAQNGGCAICGNGCTTFKYLPVDHDHTTGTVRGLLCSGCNLGLGKFKHSPELLQAALLYLERHDEITKGTR
jgi:hypothetical protein